MMDSPLYRLLAHTTPNAAVLVATLGIALIFLEFNRPGRAWPGALGLLLTLLATAALLRFGLRPWSVVLLAVCTMAFLLNLWLRLPLWLLGVVTIGLIIAVRSLIPAQDPVAIATPVAVLCGGLIGTASGALTRVAHRARRSKALD